MKRLVVPSFVAILLVSGITAPSAMAAPSSPPLSRSVVDPCARPASLPLDVAAAAALRITPGRGNKTRPAGLAKARALANQLTAGGDPCGASLEDYQDIFNEIRDSIAAGDTEATRELLLYYVESFTPYEPTPDAADERQSRPVALRLAEAKTGPCEGFESHDVKAPPEVGVSLQLATLAQLAGDDDIAEMAIQSAQKAMKTWAESGANGNANSIPDYVRLARDAQLLGLDDEVSDGLLDKARAVALDSYKLYNVVPCRMTKEKIDCFFKVAMTLQLLGSDAVSDMKMSDDLSSAVTAARQIKSGKRPRCPVEKYAFRMKFENTVDNGEVVSFDTGRVIFTVKDGRITSTDTGPLILSSAKDQTCWAKSDETWVSEGTANLTGGRFPYVVSGTDDGETLTLVLAQQGAWRVTGTGSLGCELLMKLGEAFMNIFPAMLNQGFPLPAGVEGAEGSESGLEFHEPTGEYRPWSNYYEFRMLEPKR